MGGFSGFLNPLQPFYKHFHSPCPRYPSLAPTTSSSTSRAPGDAAVSSSQSSADGAAAGPAARLELDDVIAEFDARKTVES